MGGQLGQAVVTFSTGETVCDAPIDLRSQELVAFVFPDGWDGTDLTLQARMHPRGDSDRAAAAASFLPVVDSDGTTVTINGAENTYVVSTPAVLVATYGLSEVEFVAAVAVGADYEVILILKPR